MPQQAKRIHCIGIGGIGVSALAQLWRAQGKIVSGSDAEGAGHRAENVGDVDLVIYSDAVPEDNVERAAARSRGIPEMSYAQALGEVSRDYRTIVVTGTHGKSTTTALLGLMLEAGGLDPLVIIGTRVPQWRNSNLRVPRDYANALRAANYANIRAIGGEAFASSFFVVEGDDYRDHFLELSPCAVIITSIEWDHPDYFRDLAQTVASFRKLVEKVSADGFVIINENDHGCQQLITTLQHSNILKKVRMLCFGRGSEIFGGVTLQVPGEFNRYNATAAATAALALGVPREVVERVARDFCGVWRRFEVVGTLVHNPSQPPLTLRGGDDRRPPLKVRGGLPAGKAGRGSYETRNDDIVGISDYGHHPTAIRATMKAAREAYPGRRLVLVYQPHQHSRTKHLFNDFVEVLKDAADLTIVAEIYAVKGRMEERDVSSRDIVEAVSRQPSAVSTIVYGGDLMQTKRVVLEQIKPGDVVIFMGAGDIDNLARELVKEKD